MGTPKGVSAFRSCPCVHPHVLFSCLTSQSDAPTRLKNELEQLLTLQAEIDTIHASIQKAKTVMKSNASKSVRNLLSGLENTQTILETQIDELYASLDVVGEFPEL